MLQHLPVGASRIVVTLIWIASAVLAVTILNGCSKHKAKGPVAVTPSKDAKLAQASPSPDSVGGKPASSSEDRGKLKGPVAVTPSGNAKLAQASPFPDSVGGKPASPSEDREKLTGKIIEGVGKATRASSGGQNPWLAVFEENHISRGGQIEIALMLLRLYRDAGMRDIALEGYVMDSAPVDATWFHKTLDNPSVRRRVAVQLLKEGEIRCAEFMALVFPDVTLHPIEKATEFHMKWPKQAWEAPWLLLWRIALKSMTPADAVKIKDLQDRKQNKEFIEYVLNKDPWTAKMSKLYLQEEMVIQIEEWLAALDEIEKKATQVGVQLTPTDRQNMKDLKDFLEARHKASKTMVDATCKAAGQHSNSPIAMDIGAAHTNEVCNLLDSQGRAYVVVTPQSLAARDKRSDLSLQAIDRKMLKLSVDETQLGALIDGRIKGKNYEPVLNEPWFRAKTSLALIGVTVAAAASNDRRIVATAFGGGGRQPPGGDPPLAPPFGLDPDALNRPFVRVDPRTIQRVGVGNAVVFQATVYPNNNDKMASVWVAVKHVGQVLPDAQPIETLEELLKAALQEVTAGPRVLPAHLQAVPGITPAVQVSSDAIAAFSREEGAIRDAAGSWQTRSLPK